MILDTIAKSTRKRVQESKNIISLEKIKRKATPSPHPFTFEQALRKEDIAFICEVKKGSPSKGVIAHDFPYIKIAQEYEQAGADAISVLTEPEFFLGSSQYLTEIKQAVSIPVLRKDFMIDEYQIYESAFIGADAILLICALLDTRQIKEYIRIADSLGLSCLVEAHDEHEIASALKAGARLIGVNNRDLRTFEVNIHNSIRLRALVPQNTVFVSESGIHSPQDVQALRQNGTNAVLIGEALMRSPDKQAELERLRGANG